MQLWDLLRFGEEALVQGTNTETSKHDATCCGISVLMCWYGHLKELYQLDLEEYEIAMGNHGCPRL